MNIRMSPDEIVLFNIFGINISMTVVNTWLVIAVLGLIFRAITNNPKKYPRAYMLLEAIVEFLRETVEETLQRPSKHFLPFIGTFFVFILASNWSGLLPIPYPVNGQLEWYLPPTASMSTTIAFAGIVMLSMIYMGLKKQGFWKYTSKYFKPVFVFAPLNVMSEMSKGFSMAIRLYGNIMSGGLLFSIMFIIVPIAFPSVLALFGLIAGTIQPYIFSILAMVYIGGAMGEPTSRELELLQKQRELRA